MRRVRVLAFLVVALIVSAGLARSQHGVGPDDVGTPESAREAVRAGGEARHGEVGGWSFLLIQAVGFALLVGVGAKYAWPPIRKGLDGRSHRVREGFQNAEAEEREAQRLLTEILDRLQGFSVEAQRRRDEALRQGRTLRAQIESEARGLAEQNRVKARREADLERKTALAEVRATVIERAFAAAAEILRRKADDRLQAALVDRYVDELSGMAPLLENARSP